MSDRGSTRSRVLKPEPEVEALLGMMAGAPPLSSLDPQTARAAFLAAAPIFYPDMPPIDEQRTTIADVPVRIYRPLGHDRAEPLASLLYFHGGGWVMGDMDGYGPVCATLAHEAGIAVISVDYAFAPEHPFPAALNQALAVADELLLDGENYGVDPRRLAIGGDSAGGNLAAVVALHRRDQDLGNFAYQLLIYPVADARFQSDSYRDCGDRFMLSLADMVWFRSHYLSAGGDPDNWCVSPLLATSHEGLPPAHILTCGLDPLQDEGRAYADALERAGVDVSRRHYAGQVHGFLFMGKSLPAVAPALSELASLLRTALSAD